MVAERGFQRNDVSWIPFYICFTALVFASVFGLLMATVGGAMVVEREHAVLAHGNSAQELKDNCRQDGFEMLFGGTGKKSNWWYLVCKDNQGRFGIWILQKLKDGRFLDKTAFIVEHWLLGTGTLAAIMCYLSARAKPSTKRLDEIEYRRI